MYTVVPISSHICKGGRILLCVCVVCTEDTRGRDMGGGDNNSAVISSFHKESELHFANAAIS